MVFDAADSLGQGAEAPNGSAEVLAEAGTPVRANEGASVFCAEDDVVVEAVEGGAHAIRCQTRGAPPQQPGGLPDSSRGLSAAIPPVQRKPRDAPRKGARDGAGRDDDSQQVGWHTYGVRWFLWSGAGGLRVAPTSGYFLATLRVGDEEGPRACRFVQPAGAAGPEGQLAV